MEKNVRLTIQSSIPSNITGDTVFSFLRTHPNCPFILPSILAHPLIISIIYYLSPYSRVYLVLNRSNLKKLSWTHAVKSKRKWNLQQEKETSFQSGCPASTWSWQRVPTWPNFIFNIHWRQNFPSNRMYDKILLRQPEIN